MVTITDYDADVGNRLRQLLKRQQYTGIFIV